jgi:hypothetical protein
MTKSKGVGRGGRRKGAGRPRFTETGKSSYFSTRLTQKTRDLLEAEARRREKSLSEVAEDLLQLGLEEMADLDRPKPLRALLFLISALGRRTLGPHWQDSKYSWHSNPYMFAAFRAGVVDLLDRLRPPGEIVTPPPGPEEEVWEENDDNGDNSAGGLWRFTFPDSPAEYARILVQMLIMQAQMQDEAEQMRMKYGDEIRQHWPDYPEYTRYHYGFVEARRDLNLPTQRGHKWRGAFLRPPFRKSLPSTSS